MDKNKNRPEAYPKPSKADKQFDHQPEFIDQQPNDFDDRSISDVPGTTSKVNNDPKQDLKEDNE
ncbi:MAG: hypothetical protein ACM3VS_09830 [Candidatus Dadabacteria bacterium]